MYAICQKIETVNGIQNNRIETVNRDMEQQVKVQKKKLKT